MGLGIKTSLFNHFKGPRSSYASTHIIRSTMIFLVWMMPYRPGPIARRPTQPWISHPIQCPKTLPIFTAPIQLHKRLSVVTYVSLLNVAFWKPKIALMTPQNYAMHTSLANVNNIGSRDGLLCGLNIYWKRWHGMYRTLSRRQIFWKRIECDCKVK